jgi:hypothetical protein
MRTLHRPFGRTALEAGIAALAAIGFCGIAAAQSPQTHVMTIALPGGGVEQIRFAGPVAPQIYVSAVPAPIVSALPVAFGGSSPFAELERISAAMDRQADQMFREAAALSAEPAQMSQTTLASLPAGTQEYQFVSMMNGSGVCSRSVEITSAGNGAAPRVVTHTSGNCAAAPGFQVPTQLPVAPAPSNGPRMIMTNANSAHPYAGLVHEASVD